MARCFMKIGSCNYEGPEVLQGLFESWRNKKAGGIIQAQPKGLRNKEDGDQGREEMDVPAAEPICHSSAFLFLLGP